MRTRNEADYWRRVVEWSHGDDTGLSSKAILQFMTGARVRDPFEPGDQWDFGRCYRLLKLFPSWRRRLPEIGKKFPNWRGLVRDWRKLERLYEKSPDKWSDELWDAMLVARGWSTRRPLKRRGGGGR